MVGRDQGHEDRAAVWPGCWPDQAGGALADDNGLSQPAAVPEATNIAISASLLAREILVA